jgi:hypothetical protein
LPGWGGTRQRSVISLLFPTTDLTKAGITGTLSVGVRAPPAGRAPLGPAGISPDWPAGPT